LDRAIPIEEDGVLLASTGDGSLLLLDTCLPDPRPVAPRLVVDALRVRSGEGWMDLPQSGGFTLGPYDHDLEVVLRLLSYDDPGSHRYRAWRLGYAGDWVELRGAARRSSQLPPGRYRLQLQASLGHHSSWSEVLEFGFAVAPPWWRTSWALLGALLLVLLAIVGSAWLYRR